MSDEQSQSTNGHPATAPTPPSIPSQPVPISAVPSSGPAAPTLAPTPPRRKRSVLRVLVIAIAFLIVVGGGIGFFAYDRATAIDRSTPAVVVDQFLRAVYDDGDASRIDLFVCRSWSGAAALNELPKRGSDKVLVSWGDLVVKEQGNEATATLDVRFSLPINGGAARDIQSWRLRLVLEAGWRVCGYEPVNSLNP